MSANGGQPMLGSLLMRSSTPGPGEKVLVYLETMSREAGPLSAELPPSMPPSELSYQPEIDPTPRSPRSSRSGMPQSAKAGSRTGRRTDEELTAGKMPWNAPNNGAVFHREEDADSNFQEQSTSEVGHHEPGPNDPPHGFYPSYGSSWGNMGPLPGTAHNSYQQQPPAGAPPNRSSLSKQNSGTVPIEVQAASSSRPRSNVASRTSQRDPDRSTVRDEGPQGSRGPPQSNKSQTMRSRTKTLEGGSEAGDARSMVSHGTARGGGGGRLSRAPSIAPSLSPSDSPSNPPKRRPPPSQPSQTPTQTHRAGSQMSGRPPPAQPSAPPSVHPPSQVPSKREPSPVRSAAARSQQVHSPTPSRPFSPHRHAPTSEDLFAVAARSNAAPSQVAPSVVRSQRSNRTNTQAAPPPPPPELDLEEAPEAGDVTPTRAMSPDVLTQAEEKVVREYLSRTPNRTSYAPSTLEPDVQNTHFHDMELCILLHALDDPSQHEVAKKALRKAVRQRVKRLGMKYDNESIKQLRKSYHDHDPTVHLAAQMTGMSVASGGGNNNEPPDWAKEILEGIAALSGRVDNLGPKIDSIKGSNNGSFIGDAPSYSQSQRAPTVDLHAPTDTIMDSMYQPQETELMDDSGPGSIHRLDGSHALDDDDFADEDAQNRDLSTRESDTHLRPASDYVRGREESPGQQYLEEELFKLRVRPGGSQSGYTHKTWEVARDDGEEYDEDDDGHIAITESGLPEIPGSQPNFTDVGHGSPQLASGASGQDMTSPAGDQGAYGAGDFGANEEQLPPPWQRIHQRLLSWAIVWPMSELDAALNSTTRGCQIDEVALSIWSTQTYKRYVRSKMTDTPQGRVDRLFVPPNMADAISNAVYNGRHGDACAMLRDLWSPFGLEGMPRLLIVLAKHRTDENHWVVHRFSLPDGTLTTYDTYPERCLPDGRPLGWWFAIRIAWPNAIYPSPDHLMQKMVRLHRPMQLGIDNSVAAAGIWRNLLMGSRAERSLDLERLRDLINTEVRNLRQRKQMGKLSVGATNARGGWYD